jgi:hypothetical protein
MAQPVMLRLSPAEWMLCVMTVQPDAASALAESVNRTMTPERLQGALAAAHDVLLARDLARLNADGRLDINPVLRTCANAVLTPRASLGLTLIEADGQSRVVFYNWLPGFAVGTWVDGNQIRTFELLDTDDMIGERILSQWLGVATAPAISGPAETKTYTMTAASLPALPVDRQEKVNGLAVAVSRGGMPQDDALALEHAFASPTRRAVLAAANQSNPSTRTLMWLSNNGKSWLISQASSAAIIKIASVNANGLAQGVSAFVRETLAPAR